MQTLLIDNYDSYTFNLFQLIARITGREPVVVRNDERSWRELAALDVDNIVISPGPGRPEREGDFGVCGEVLRHASRPVLGVCLGHQGIGHVSGGRVVHAPEVMHGRMSAIWHDDDDLFAGIPQGFTAVRYHSLTIDDPLPPDLKCTAWTADGVVMGVRHRARPLWGVQFHPESIATEHGLSLVSNFNRLTTALTGAQRREPPRRRGRPRPTTSAAPHLSVHARGMPVWREPEDVFVGLYGDARRAFWLDSSRVELGLSRYSFVGAADGPYSDVARYDVKAGSVSVERADGFHTFAGSIFDYLSGQLAARRPTGTERLPFPFDGGYVGYFGYELKADSGGDRRYESSVPDAAFVFADRFVAFDHVERTVHAVCINDDKRAARRWLNETERRLWDLSRAMPTEPAPFLDADVVYTRPLDEYHADIERCQRFLADGESYEICLTNEISLAPSPDPLEVYRRLRMTNPAPYSAYLRLDGLAVLCSSPERFLKVEPNGWVETKPIKGTCARHEDIGADRRAAQELARDQKTRAENLMIVDLLRNDLGQVCEIGSVSVPKLMHVESYATVHQLVSTIRGRLREDVDVPACVRACFPGGSMTGAPKKRTLEIIDALERRPRGVYSGALGYLAVGGAADLNIVIRTIVSTPDRMTIGTGGAIVMQSDPAAEVEEIQLKAQALLAAVDQAQAKRWPLGARVGT